ncbi:electron transport complex subunit RsxG [Saccharophagus degradans]|uniref:Ion-translocating oxidoreductase complex subunit G n=1 Tax=Saccharophagus degradans TaxID=86304 RepID=A0AAW7XA49_9GAMM|nr:electron transport complex subunit RsxG [Saccharophagus degradans]MDO6424533.1 electron transport complex subunit RsxG [Saccharophagus degradans]MDO6608844.1 electron transport complex subunit RsxG [Saccharophagus degradans]
MLGKSITKNSVILGGFALVTAAILAFTFQATAEKIAEQEKRAAEKALLQIVPRERHDNDMLSDTLTFSAEQSAVLGAKGPVDVHLAKLDGELVAAIIPAIAPDGYSGEIKLIVGVNADGSVAGVRVLAHKETPGLGDKVDLNKSDWVLSFNGKSLLNPPANKWKVKKDGGEFDQFTGATITPRAVVKRVQHVLEFFEANKAALTQNTPAAPAAIN